MFSGRQFVICKTNVAFWHVASVGTQSNFLSVYFTGNLFQHQGLYQSVITLFPMTGVTVPMEPEVMGKGKLSSQLRRGSNLELQCIFATLFCNTLQSSVLFPQVSGKLVLLTEASRAGA